ncbi:MAG: hypothetical protein MR413_00820 [Clostridia bacterium]|nr:hypothetical protein [Clostridia bacterium]
MNELSKTRIHIFSGHFGSGKTEIALNFAIAAKNAGNKVTIIDLDIVNPYFRSKDAKEYLENNGINLIANKFASTNIDMPIVPAEVLSVFNNDSGVVIFDVGGDDDGAYALGRYLRFFEQYGYEMHFVVNTRRPMTSTTEEFLEIAERIESASRLKFTDIYNNTNLSVMTDENTLLSDYGVIELLSKKMGIPITAQCGTEKALSKIPANMKKFKIETYLKMPF